MVATDRRVEIPVEAASIALIAEQSLAAYFGPAARLLRGKSRARVRNPLKRDVGILNA